MKFDYTEEQRLLAESVRRFVAQDYGFEARRRIVSSAEGYSPAAWATLAELGLLALPLPADAGGFGGGAVDLMSVMESIGEALVVEPYLATLMGARFIARAGSEAQRREILPAVAEGALKLAVAHGEKGARYDLARIAATAAPAAGGFVLDGEKVAVMHAPMADRLVVSARTGEGPALFLVDPKSPGVGLREYAALDEVRAADVTLRGVQVAAGAMIGEAGAALPLLEEVFDFATALLCAEAVGAIRSANDATLEYLKTRKQFGVPIGSFQALQHRMVDMVIAAEQARSMASLACASVDAPRDAAERRRVVSAAKIRIADACRQVSQEAVQLHGGMGMSEELKVSHTFRRLTVIAQQFGDADHHLARFAAAAEETR